MKRIRYIHYDDIIYTGPAHGFIGGGAYNTIAAGATYSSILGGSGNTIGAGYQWAGVFGQNVAAQASNTFHVECLNAINTPPGPPGFGTPPGTMYYQTGVLPGPLAACKVLMLF